MTSNAFVGKCKKREKMYHNSLVWNSQLPKRHISPITTSSSPSWKSLWPRKKNGGGGRSTSSTIWERGNGELISIIRAFGLPGYCMYGWLCSMSLYVNREEGGTIIPFWKKAYYLPTYKTVVLQTIIHKQVLPAICPESFLLWIFKKCWLYLHIYL